MLLSDPCPHCGTLAAPHDHPGRTDWMPIGSAPKGRRDILVTLEGTALMAVAHHNPAVARPDSGGWFLYGRSWKPSHWLWLPAPLLALGHVCAPKDWACLICWPPIETWMAAAIDFIDLAAMAAP